MCFDPDKDMFSLQNKISHNNVKKGFSHRIFPADCVVLERMNSPDFYKASVNGVVCKAFGKAAGKTEPAIWHLPTFMVKQFLLAHILHQLWPFNPPSCQVLSHLARLSVLFSLSLSPFLAPFRLSDLNFSKFFQFLKSLSDTYHFHRMHSQTILSMQRQGPIILHCPMISRSSHLLFQTIMHVFVYFLSSIHWTINSKMPGAGPILFITAFSVPSTLVVVTGTQVLTEDILFQCSSTRLERVMEKD